VGASKCARAAPASAGGDPRIDHLGGPVNQQNIVPSQLAQAAMRIAATVATIDPAAVAIALFALAEGGR
jgi:hypothetical protein